MAYREYHCERVVAFNQTKVFNYFSQKSQVMKVALVFLTMYLTLLLLLLVDIVMERKAKP